MTALYKCYSLHSLHGRTEEEYTVNDLDATVKHVRHLHVSIISNVFKCTSTANIRRYLNNELWDNGFSIFALSTLFWKKEIDLSHGGSNRACDGIS